MVTSTFREKETMPKSRKTFDVQKVKNTANTALAYNYPSEHYPNVDEYRRGICSLIEEILLKADQYKGFNYVDGFKASQANGTEYKRHYY